MRLPHPEKTTVLLIGTSDYATNELADLPSVRNNLDDVLGVLTDARIGGLDRDRCTVLTNPADVTTVYRTLRTQALATEDTLIVYYSGHGLLDDDNELFLGLPHTNLDELPVTAFKYELLADVVRTSTARNRLVILDCCFSGFAASSAMGDLDNALSGLLVIEGTFVLTSSAANQVSTAPPGERNTTFTGELLRLLTTGVVDGPEFLTLSTIYTQLLTSAQARGLPQPRRRSTGTADLLALARNPAQHGPGTVAPKSPPPPLAQRTISGRKAAGVLAMVVVLASGVPLTVHWLDTDDPTGDTASAALPLKVLSTTEFHSIHQDAFFVLPKPVTMSSAKTRAFTDAVSRQSNTFRSWYTEHHGAPAIDAGFTNVTIRSDTGGPVRITDMEVDTTCDEPFDGTAMIGYTQGGGEESVTVAFDLDSPAPIPEAVGNTTTGLVGSGENYFASKTVLVEPDESLTLSLGAHTARQSCTFTFRAVVATDAGTVKQRIDDHGEPFVITAKAAPTSENRPLSGYRAAYVQDETLVWQQKDPTDYGQ